MDIASLSHMKVFLYAIQGALAFAAAAMAFFFSDLSVVLGLTSMNTPSVTQKSDKNMLVVKKGFGRQEQPSIQQAAMLKKASSTIESGVAATTTDSNVKVVEVPKEKLVATAATVEEQPVVPVLKVEGLVEKPLIMKAESKNVKAIVGKTDSSATNVQMGAAVLVGSTAVAAVAARATESLFSGTLKSNASSISTLSSKTWSESGQEASHVKALAELKPEVSIPADTALASDGLYRDDLSRGKAAPIPSGPAIITVAVSSVLAASSVVEPVSEVSPDVLEKSLSTASSATTLETPTETMMVSSSLSADPVEQVRSRPGPIQAFTSSDKEPLPNDKKLEIEPLKTELAKLVEETSLVVIKKMTFVPPPAMEINDLVESPSDLHKAESKSVDVVAYTASIAAPIVTAYSKFLTSALETMESTTVEAAPFRSEMSALELVKSSSTVPSLWEPSPLDTLEMSPLEVLQTHLERARLRQQNERQSSRAITGSSPTQTLKLSALPASNIPSTSAVPANKSNPRISSATSLPLAVVDTGSFIVAKLSNDVTAVNSDLSMPSTGSPLGAVESGTSDKATSLVPSNRSPLEVVNPNASNGSISGGWIKDVFRTPVIVSSSALFLSTRTSDHDDSALVPLKKNAGMLEVNPGSSTASKFSASLGEKVHLGDLKSKLQFALARKFFDKQ